MVGEKKGCLFDLESSQLSQVLLGVVWSGKAFGSTANLSEREVLAPGSRT